MEKFFENIWFGFLIGLIVTILSCLFLLESIANNIVDISIHKTRCEYVKEYEKKIYVDEIREEVPYIVKCEEK